MGRLVSRREKEVFIYVNQLVEQERQLMNSSRPFFGVKSTLKYLNYQRDFLLSCFWLSHLDEYNRCLHQSTGWLCMCKSFYLHLFTINWLPSMQNKARMFNSMVVTISQVLRTTLNPKTLKRMFLVPEVGWLLCGTIDSKLV